MKLAVFDIDGTLIKGASERLFWRFLFLRGRQGPRQILAFLLFMARYLPTGGIQTPRKNKAYLAGLRVEEVEALAREFVAEKLLSRLQPAVLQRLEQHRRRGDIVVLMSGTLQPIARALADALHVPHVCATLLSQRNGVFLAQPPEIHPYDAAKLSLVKQMAGEFRIEMRHVAAYADSKHDLFLLSSVGEPVAVDPDPTLLAAALEHNWEIISARPAETVLRS